MMPLKYSNFPVAPYFIHYFFGSSLCYYFTTMQQGSGEVNRSFLLAFLFSNGLSCKMCLQLSDYMSLNILILYDWEQ